MANNKLVKRFITMYFVPLDATIEVPVNVKSKILIIDCFPNILNKTGLAIV